MCPSISFWRDRHKPFRQIKIRIDRPAGCGYVLPGDRIVPHLLIFAPVDPNTSALPNWEVVEVDAALEEEFVLKGDALAFELFAGF